jgi:DNA-binding NarL/FixJ family response regulator
MLLADEVDRLNDPSIAPLPALDDQRLAAMSQVINATGALRQRFAQLARGGNIDGISLGCELSPRRGEVLKLLLFGMSEKRIALQVRLSRHTIHEHVKAIYKRFDVNSRPELMAKFLRDALESVSAERAVNQPSSATPLLSAASGCC